MKILNFILIAFLFSIHTSHLYAQRIQIQVDASFDTTAIKIGDQLHLNVEVLFPSDAKVAFPQFGDSIGKIEIVDRTKLDTLKSEDGKSTTYKQSLTITAFDPGNYMLQPFYFYYQLATSKTIDSIATSTLYLQVQTIAVDTNKVIKDIKAPLDVPYTLEEFLPYLIMGLIALAIILIILWYIKKKNRQKLPVVVLPPPRPAHEIALEALHKTEAQKLWQDGHYKQYQSEVSDTIRMYIENRFSIPALELTTDETLKHLKRNLITAEAHEKLKYMLQLADMVKFAKAIPLGSENEMVMEYAYQFIALTKPATISDFETIEKGEDKK
ncbi:MAG: hypothetical protein Q8M15_05270 [Bacteroidota bacterium]|nr:hypothetical protein [Bacteroidota bacterium]